MENEKPLDDIQKIQVKEFGKSSFRMLLISIFCFVSFIIFSIINPSSDFSEIVMMIFLLGFIVTNISGLIYTIRSINDKEPNTVFKIIGAIGNTLFFLVMLSMMAFVTMDIVTWF